MLKKNFTRRHLSDKIYQNLGFSKNFSSVIIDNFFEFFLLELEKSNNIKISSFGTFKVSQKKERIGRNPHTKVKPKLLQEKLLNLDLQYKLQKRLTINE